MGVSENSGTPKSSILRGFSIIFTIHFGVFPYFWKHPYVYYEFNSQQTRDNPKPQSWFLPFF